MTWRLLVCAGVLAGLAGLAGCSRGDPREIVIDAASPSAFGRWRMRLADRFSADEWKEFEAALQELRLRVMAEREASGSEAVERALRARIGGSTLREVLVLGNEAKLARLRPLRAELTKAIAGNELLVTRADDREALRHLQGLRARQEERLRAATAEIEAAERRLVALGGTVPVPEREETRPTGLPDGPLTRETVLAEFSDMVSGQRSVSRLNHGGGRVTFDRTGAQLAGEAKVEFLAAQKAAEISGNVVVAVRARDQWWVFDGPGAPPTFSREAAAVLTDADRREIRETWGLLQAELWARKKSFEEMALK